MSIKQQIEQWAKQNGLQLVDNDGYLNDCCNNVDIEHYGETRKIRVHKCRKHTYIYLPMPTNAPYHHRYQFHIADGKAYLWRYLFK